MSTTTSALPTCVSEVREAAERLHRAIFNQPFPSLDAPPSDESTLRRLINEAIEWATAVDTAFGTAQHERGHVGLQEEQLRLAVGLWGALRTYGPPETSIELLSQPKIRAEIDDPGRFGQHSPMSIKVSMVDSNLSAKLRREPTSSRHPTGEDILGPVPDTFLFSLTAQITDTYGYALQAGTVDVSFEKRVDLSCSAWPSIELHLRQSRIVIVAKALGFAGWARSAIGSLETALFPEIHWSVEKSGKRINVQISQAGVQRTVCLTDRQVEFLEQLSREGSACCIRRDKKAVSDMIPELANWIESAGAVKGNTDESRYRVPPEVADRIGRSLVNER